MAFEELTSRQAVMWGSAPFENIAETISDMHVELVEYLEPSPGEQWLDLGTGAGDVAFHASRAGAVEPTGLFKQSVAAPPDVDHVGKLGPGGAKLAAEPGGVRVDRPRHEPAAVPPDVAQELILGENTLRGSLASPTARSNSRPASRDGDARRSRTVRARRSTTSSPYLEHIGRAGSPSVAGLHGSGRLAPDRDPARPRRRHRARMRGRGRPGRRLWP